MIDRQTQDEILESIITNGRVNIVPLKINTNIEHVLSFSSGAARLQSTLIRKAILILSKPNELNELSSQQIRCCLCHKVISYPAWYYNIRYNVNYFHYFICFDNDSVSKPSVKCYRIKEGKS